MTRFRELRRIEQAIAKSRKVTEPFDRRLAQAVDVLEVGDGWTDVYATVEHRAFTVGVALGVPKEERGTKAFTDVLEADSESLFPLQGALGYENPAATQHTHSRAWTTAGLKAKPDLTHRIVTFSK